MGQNEIDEKWILDKMNAAIVAMLKGYKISEPVYSVILTYNTQPGEELPPWISVGTQREREAFAAQEPQNLSTLLWDGEVLEIYDPVESLLNDMDFMDACAGWSLQVHEGTRQEEKITAMMQRLCFALQKQDWSAVFPVTEDFTVAACTTEGGWLEENMSVLLTDERYKEFIRKGYLSAPPCCGCGGE